MEKKKYERSAGSRLASRLATFSSHFPAAFKTKGLLRIGQMYFGSQSLAEERRENEKKMWLAVRLIVNLQTFHTFSLD